MLLVDALYINNSGGKVLLDYLINSLLSSQTEVFFLLDERCEESYRTLNLKNVKFVKSTLNNRKKYYQDDNKKFTCILCFANLAPPVKCGGKVVTYFHNLLLSEIPSGTPIKKRILLLAKRYLAKSISGNSDTFVVQTDYAKRSFLKAYGSKEVRILPFFNDFGIKAGVKESKTFLYVSDGNPHKNHMRLLYAWSQVKDVNAQLWLTISDSYPELQRTIDEFKTKGLKISNFKGLSREELNMLYAKAEYLIYPSLLESFGLGLIEGALADCKIIASDLPYAYEVVEPSAVFDAMNIESIVNTIEKVLEEDIPHSVLKVKNSIDELIEFISNKK